MDGFHISDHSANKTKEFISAFNMTQNVSKVGDWIRDRCYFKEMFYDLNQLLHLHANQLAAVAPPGGIRSLDITNDIH